MKWLRVGVSAVAIWLFSGVALADDASTMPVASVTQSRLPDLGGMWVSNCFQFDAGVYQVRSFEFVLDHLVTITTISYPDNVCSQEPIESQVVSATWDLGEPIVTEEGLRAYTIDVLLSLGAITELTTVKQIIHFQNNSFVLGINKKLDRYPQNLDWEIGYTLIH